ncbi:MAG: 4a-hydroxytetrahydrobiopterin dehydratase [Candidatus Schekmanbacteria bacterium]|nr:4a-hydroxytetrahydrobiopterin dehydratase [Candidatus Schekmanbacteria bacterium]
MNDLTSRTCRPCEGGVEPLTAEQAGLLATQLDASWSVGGKTLERRFSFANFHDTMAFVNAVAWIAHQENHHPDLAVSYNRCVVTYQTHAIHGLSENDFICAAKVDALLAPAADSPSCAVAER